MIVPVIVDPQVDLCCIVHDGDSVDIQDSPLRAYLGGSRETGNWKTSYLRQIERLIKTKCSRKEAYEAEAEAWFLYHWQDFSYCEVVDFIRNWQRPGVVVLSPLWPDYRIWSSDQPFPEDHWIYCELVARLLGEMP